ETPSSAPAEETGGQAAVAGSSTGTPMAGGSGGSAQEATAAAAPAPVMAPVQAPAQVPAQVPIQVPAAPAVGEFSEQRTERTTTSTTTTTSTRLEAGFLVEVTCEGLCLLEDLAAPELTGPDGPLSEKILARALEEELRRTGADTALTEGLAEQLTRSGWTLADRKLGDGNETLVFARAGAE
ncbi:hypothetical protein ACFP5Z_05775, partial [Kocuria oceani]